VDFLCVINSMMADPNFLANRFGEPGLVRSARRWIG